MSSSSDDLSTIVTKSNGDKDQQMSLKHPTTTSGKEQLMEIKAIKCPDQIDASSDLVLHAISEDGQRFVTKAVVHAVNV